MPILSDPRHERFAQNLAAGMKQGEAYEKAGYKANRGNAARLNADESIRQRLAEIMKARETFIQDVSAVAVEKAGLTKAWVLDTLRQNIDRAMTAEPVRDSEGNAIGDYTYQGSVANRALELIGKELGMFVDRKEVGGPGDFTGMELNDLERLFRSALAERGVAGEAADAIVRALTGGRAGADTATAH